MRLGMGRLSLHNQVRGGGASNPIVILGTDLLGYWDANRADLITQSGGLVSQWLDIRHGYALVQATGANQPGYSATGFNGRPCVTGNGTGQYMTLAPDPFPVDAFELWAVVDQTAFAADATIRVIFQKGGNTASTAQGIRRAVVSAVNRARSSYRSSNETQSLADFSGRHVVRGVFLTGGTLGFGTHECFIDGVSDGLTNVGTGEVIPQTRARLFASTLDTAASFYQGGACAILVTNPLSASKSGALTAALMQRVA